MGGTMQLTLQEVAAAVNGRLLGENKTMTSVSIDTRTLKEGALYVAIKGERFDGHDFAEQAIASGALAVLVEHALPTDEPQIVVEDSRLALAELAGAWRDRLSVKVIGITGSNGKTTVKEMIASILSVSANVLYTQGNLNNDIGVPLTLLRLDESHDFAVIEMGANHPGEIGYTSRYAKPDVSVITNVGAAHIEGFGSLEGVAKTKGEIVSNLKAEGVAILNRDDAFYDYWKTLLNGRQRVCFGAHADVQASEIEYKFNAQKLCMSFDLMTRLEKETMHVQLAGEHNVRNALAAAAACLQFDIDLQQIKLGLSRMTPVNGRLQAKCGQQGNLIIDDTYNANPDSLKAALEVLSHCQGKHWLVLGAFGELGIDSEQMHRDMGGLCKKFNVERLFATGQDSRYCVESFGGSATYFEQQQALIDAVQSQLTGVETILVKGSRAQKMEHVVMALTDNKGE